MAVSISISITQNSQNITNNTSNVTVKVNCSWTGGSWNAVYNAAGEPQANGTLTIDGTSYPFRSTFNSGHTTTGSQTLFTKTVNIKHGDNGAKNLSCSASYDTYVSSGTVSANASKTLTTIPRKSTLSVSDGTLNKSQTLTVTRKSTSFTHSIKAVCGSNTLYIKADGSTQTSEVKHSDCSIPFTPPLNWAKQNTTDTSVTVQYTITTYNGSSSVGYNQYSVKYTIPDTVKPSCKVEVVDGESIEDAYGFYVQGLSTFWIMITPTLAYDSPIASYSITADGNTYAKKYIETGIVKNSGQQKITAKVTDKRGRTGTAEITVTVKEYSPPKISSIAVRRCNEDLTPNDEGDWAQIVFDATMTKLEGQNGAVNTGSYTYEVKKSSEDDYLETAIELTDVYNVEGAVVKFPADPGSSYDIRLTASDSFASHIKTTSVSTGYTIMHWKASGRGMAVGKVSELDNVFDVAMQTRLLGGLLYPVIEPETDLNDEKMRVPGFYVGENVSTYNYLNCPITAGTFTLEVLSAGINGQVLQRLTRCDKLKPLVFQRYWYGGSWGNWFWAGSDEVLLYENSAGSTGTITLRLNNDPEADVVSAAHFRYLEIYFTDNNGKGGGYTKIWNPNDKTISLQITEPSTAIYSRQTFYKIDYTQLVPNIETASYYRITSAGAVNTSIGTNYIKIVRVVGRP